MKIDHDLYSCEPLVGCGNYFPECTSQGYPWDMTMGADVIEYIMQYRTDPEPFAEILPEPFIPADPIVTVLFAWLSNSDVNGYYTRGEYALCCVGLNCRFDGERDHVSGIYNCIMPENNNYCVHMGRDSSGAPKIHVNLPYPYKNHNNETVCDCQTWAYSNGQAAWQSMMRLEFGEMKKGDDAACKKWKDTMDNCNILQLKHIPASTYREDTHMVDISTPTHFGFVREIKEVWEGKDARFILGDLDPHLFLERRCVEEYRKLPVLEIVNAACWRSAVGGGESGYLK